MPKREFMEQQLNYMAEEGMVRKSDVISIVEKQKTSIHESDGKTTAFRNGIRGNNSSGQDWIG